MRSGIESEVGEGAETHARGQYAAGSETAATRTTSLGTPIAVRNGEIDGSASLDPRPAANAASPARMKRARTPGRTKSAGSSGRVDRDGPRFSKRLCEEWQFRATLRNSLRASLAADRSTWLRVPKVLDADPADLRIDYEYLDGWSQVRTVIRDRRFGGLVQDELHRVFFAIGAALEELHRHTHRLHGDFDLDNVLLKSGADRAVFVDFTPPVYRSFRAYNQGDPYWDIAMFVICVRAKYPPHLIDLAFRPELRELSRAFVAGYFREDPSEYDERRLERSVRRMLDTTYLGRSFAGRVLRRSRLFRTDDLAPER